MSQNDLVSLQTTAIDKAPTTTSERGRVERRRSKRASYYERFNKKQGEGEDKIEG
jgi:hypothetical protein